jgi:glycosyltransferase involved in cell wall biosynthesis
MTEAKEWAKPTRTAIMPLRVMIVAPSLDILGGQAVQAARLMEHLRAEVAVDVSFLAINPRLPGVLRRLQSIKYVRTVVTSALYVVNLLVRIRACDIVHVFSASYFSFILAPTPAILVARLYGKKVVLNYRSGEAEDHLARWPRTTRPVLRLVDAIVVPSGYLVDVFARFGFTARPIFNFVDTVRFQFRLRRPLRPVFLSNRNLEPLYNVGCILRAFALVQQVHPDASLMVVGDGSQRAELERLAGDLNLLNIDFLGRIEHERMPELYESTDIYLNAPDIDNMPGSIIEAYASGLPVVTTDAGGIPYIVTDRVTGLLVPRGAHEAMASAALSLLAADQFASELARRARDECDKYSWAAVRKEWLKLYSELAGAGAESAPASPREGELEQAKEGLISG